MTYGEVAYNIEKLVAGLNRKVELEYARQLVALGWTPPPGHPVLKEDAK